MFNTSTLTRLIGPATLALVLQAAPAFACVGCREPGAETMSSEVKTVMAGFAFSWSVLFMLGFVLAVVGGMSFYIWQTCRQVERQNRQS